MMTAPWTPYGDHVERYVLLGYLPIPIRPSTKRPAINAWQRLEPAQALALAIPHAQASIGIRTDNLAGIDGDITHLDVANDVLNFVLRTVVKDHPALLRYGRPPKFLVLCQAEHPGPKRTSPAYLDLDGNPQQIECMGIGQQVVLDGIHPDTQEPYAWPHGDPIEQEVAVYELPVLTQAQWEAIVAYFIALAEARGWKRVSEASSPTQGNADAPTFPVAGLTLELAADALSRIPNDDLAYDDYIDLGMALHQQGNGDAEWFALWDQWCQGSSKYGGETYNWRRWSSFQAHREGGVTMRSVLREAEDNGWTRPQSVEGARLEQGAPEEQFPMLLSGAGDPEAEPAPAAAPEHRGRGLFPELTFPGDWGDYAPPPQTWAWEQLVPIGEATLLYALGGTGKTRLVQQLATAIATGTPFLGRQVQRGTVIMFLCEDDRDQIIRRQDTIERNGGPKRTEIGENVVMLPRKGQDNLLLVFDRHGGPKRTDIWKQLAKLCLVYQDSLSLLFIDTLSDVFGGNEMDRGHARQMIQQACVSIAMRCQCGVLLAAHPSLASVKDGRGSSGSTSWEGAVRSRLYLERDADREGLLVLRHPKSNLGAMQEDILLQMVDGYLLEVAPEELGDTSGEIQCRSDLLEVIARADSRKHRLTDAANSPSCFWKVAAREHKANYPGAKAWTREQWEMALTQLEQKGAVRLITYRADREAREIVLTNRGFLDQAEVE